MIKPVVKVIEVPMDASAAYHLFAVRMGEWWPLDKRSISAHGVGAAAKALEADAIPGGAIIEIAADDTRHLWGNFTDCDPPNSIAINFHMGQPKDHLTHLVISFMQMGKKQTLVKLVHGGWDSFGELGDMMRDGYDKGWDEIFCESFAKACAKRH